MAKPSLDDIYSRLRQVPGYHPMSADTFADWAMEAGDSIEIERDGTVYRVPVGNSTVRWNGSHRVNIRTEGNKERPSVARASVNKYTGASAGGGGGSAGIRNSGEIHNYVEDLERNTQTKFDQTAEAISAEAKARTDLGVELTGKISVEAGRISAVVTRDGKIRAGMIVDAINEDSSVLIKADRIVLSGTTTIDDVMKVSGDSVYIGRPLYVTAGGRNVLIQGGYVRAYDIYVDAGARKLNVADLSVDGNVLKITYADGTKLDFSKATSLTGVWSGSMYTGKAYKVEARQAGSRTPVATQISPAVNTASYNYMYWNSGVAMANVSISDAAGEEILQTGINVNEVYQNGRGSVTPEQHHTYYPAVCTKANPIGSGRSDYAFEFTEQTGIYHVGDPETFWV